MITQIHFICYAKPVPQGSMKSFVLHGKGGAKDRAIVTSDNKHLRPYRQEVTLVAMVALRDAGLPEPFAAKHVPVAMVLDFYFQKPKSVTKKRMEHVVKPDMDKLIRSTTDALTGILYDDDAQIVEVSARKHYGSPERVECSLTLLISQLAL